MGGGGGMGGGGWGGGRGGGGGGRSRGGQGMQNVKVTVRWESAAPVHAALLKSEAADASKFADWSKDYYVVTVIGLPQMGQRPRGGDDNDQQQQPDPDRAKEMQERMQDHMKQSTSLKLKSRTIAPERVETLESPGGRTLVFLFPRTSNILADDKEVTFATSMGRMEIHSKFSLKEMQFKDKLEL
jgi:hypothetical protein